MSQREREKSLLLYSNLKNNLEKEIHIEVWRGEVRDVRK
jgi:hypothetical protein